MYPFSARLDQIDVLTTEVHRYTNAASRLCGLLSTYIWRESYSNIFTTILKVPRRS